MNGFQVYQQQPATRFTRRFTPEEVLAALRQYLQANGVTVPEGKEFLWGIDSRDEEKSLTLVIDATSI